MENAKLIKIDRNGTKYYEGLIECPKCCGTGMIVHHMENGKPSYQWNDGGVCWKCSGKGKVLGKWVERTPEHEAKLTAKRIERENKKLAEATAKADERNKKFFEREGFSEEGKTLVVLGNTFEAKDQLKELGCKYSGTLGWHIGHQIDGFETLVVDVSECYDKNYMGSYDIALWKLDVKDKIKEANLEATKKASKSEYVGSEGDRISVKATVKRVGWYDTKFGTTWIYTFEDIFQNIFVWKTSNIIRQNEGDQVELIGTVKEHNEYRGERQTVLTRCKIQ